MYQLLKPFLFLFQAEKAHHLTITLARIGFGIPIIGWLLKNYYSVEDKSLERKLFGNVQARFWIY